MTRKERVRMIRDRAVQFAMANRHWEAIGTQRRLTARAWPLMLSYRTPFQRLFNATKEAKYWLALCSQKANLPYGLNIWFEDIPEHMANHPDIMKDFTSQYVRKVLNVEWDRQDDLDILSFRRGLWETQAFLSDAALEVC